MIEIKPNFLQQVFGKPEYELQAEVEGQLLHAQRLTSFNNDDYIKIKNSILDELLKKDAYPATIVIKLISQKGEEISLPSINVIKEIEIKIASGEIREYQGILVKSIVDVFMTSKKLDKIYQNNPGIVCDFFEKNRNKEKKVRNIYNLSPINFEDFIKRIGYTETEKKELFFLYDEGFRFTAFLDPQNLVKNQLSKFAEVMDLIYQNRGDNRSVSKLLSLERNEVKNIVRLANFNEEEHLSDLLEAIYSNEPNAIKTQYCQMKDYYEVVATPATASSEKIESALNFFVQKRFETGYEPCGWDNGLGSVTGGDRYKYQDALAFPKIKSNQLTPGQWRRIALQNTAVMPFFPKEVFEKVEFWGDYTEFIGKGKYLDNPDYYDKTRLDFEKEHVIAFMPASMKDPMFAAIKERFDTKVEIKEPKNLIEKAERQSKGYRL